MTDPALRLGEISERLEAAARRLREDELEAEEATALAGECAQLASEAAAEVDRLARPTASDATPGQEELL